jgi:transposase
MTSKPSTTSPVVRVAIDVAKLTHQVLIELPSGQRRTMRVANAKPERDRLVAMLRALNVPCEIAFEPTGDYHRPLAYVLGRAGFHLCLVSSIAVARTREALYNSWDKNDPKDAQVILHLLKNGTTQRYLDPLVTGHQDLQEMANTYQHVSLRKVRLQHSLITHHLPLYFPEAERYLHSSRAEWFTELLLFTPCPAAVRQYTKAAFVAAAREQIAGRKVDKARWLADFYETACTSVGLPVAATSETIRMFRVVLEEYRALCQLRKRLEAEIATRLATLPDFVRLQPKPGTSAASAACDSFSNIAASISARNSRGNFAGLRTCRSAGTRGCGTPSGWRAPSRSGCNRIAFAGSLRTTSVLIRRTRIDDGKGTRRWRPRWPASRMPWSRPAPSIAASRRRRDQAGGSLRQGPSRRMRPRR